NEELILIYAEANIGSNNAEAVNAINVIRNAAGIGDYTGATSDAALVDEVLYQRRYSLFGEAHRWIDARRYDRLDELPLDRSLDKVHVQFPRPESEFQ
ncbi:MAG: RagB/SusD family nutrient uptake outer membrane protein, partial [Bacteroidota bacterium]